MQHRMQSSDVFPGGRRVERLLLSRTDVADDAWATLFQATEEAVVRIGALERQVEALARAVASETARRVTDGYVVFIAATGGYRIEEATGAPPACGSEIETAEGRLEVIRIGASPFPDDTRPCVFAQPH